MKAEHPIRSLCEALEVSSSGYYDWSKRQSQPSLRAQENVRLAQQIAQIHQGSRHDTVSNKRMKELQAIT